MKEYREGNVDKIKEWRKKYTEKNYEKLKAQWTAYNNSKKKIITEVPSTWRGHHDV